MMLVGFLTSITLSLARPTWMAFVRRLALYEIAASCADEVAERRCLKTNKSYNLILSDFFFSFAFCFCCFVVVLLVLMFKLMVSCCFYCCCCFIVVVGGGGGDGGYKWVSLIDWLWLGGAPTAAAATLAYGITTSASPAAHAVIDRS